jgi:hypothetical protein
MYQDIYNEFWPAYLMKKYSLAISMNNWQGDAKTKKLYDNITGEYGCKDAYTLTTLQPFNPDEHQQVTNDIFINSNDANQDIDF